MTKLAQVRSRRFLRLYLPGPLAEGRSRPGPRVRPHRILASPGSPVGRVHPLPASPGTRLGPPCPGFDASGIEPAAQASFNAELQAQELRFARLAKGRYLCFEALSSIDGRPFAAIGDLYLFDASGELMTMPKPGWKVLWVDSEEVLRESGDAENAIDSQADTHWHTVWSAEKPGYPHRLVIDLGASQVITGLRYLSRGGPAAAGGRIKDCRVYLNDRPFGLRAAE